MAQHDYVIANGTGAAVRSDLNNGLAAIVSQNSGTTEPTTTYAYMRWADTTAGVMKMRNGANNAWITLYQLDGEWSTIAFENGSASAPSIYFKDSGTDTGIYSPGADQVAISTNGTGRLFITDTRLRLNVNSQFHISNNTDASSGLQFIGSDSAESTIGTMGNHALTFRTNSVERMRLTSTGLGIGTASPSDTSGFGGTLDINGTTGAACYVRTNGSAANYGFIGHYGTDFYVNNNSNGPTRFFTNGAERARLTASGQLLVGTSTSGTGSSSTQYARLQVNGNTGGSSGVIAVGAALNTSSVVSGSGLGYLVFADKQAGEYAWIGGECDGTPGTNDYPGRLVFSTTADGASSPTERMRINESGGVLIGKTVQDNSTPGTRWLADGLQSSVRSGNPVMLINRSTNDGTIISLRQDDVEEGTISVSGTTVSYNGAHLSRWSQIPGIDPHDKDQRPEILRGTVMSNLDEMCDWTDPETDEPQANEQLNKTKVSDVEGDKNVAGIFQSWDDDDDTWVNDYYLAMTGDFVIRIGAGVTVERGDLLMSAGDGTAKPQDDDIIRSKTIAKVTSTNVSCTYDDGSYCVPCVLMAC